MARPPTRSEPGETVKLSSPLPAPGVGYRAMLVLAVLAAAWLVLASGLARRYAEAQPTLALAVWPGDARALAGRAAGRIRIGATPADLMQAQGEALDALRRDLTLADAYAVLGSVADMRGQATMARRDMAASDALSRRVLIARLWLIQDAVARGNVAEALGHFDIALRTSEEAKPLLYPALGRALGDDRLVPAIAALLQRRPAWAADFLYTSIANGVASENLARVLERLHPVPDYAGVDLRSLLIAQLIREGRFATARRLALPRLPAASASRLVDGGFADPRGDPPFNWMLADTATLSAERIGDRPGLRAYAEQDAGGDVASQLLMLPPGSYGLSSLRRGEFWPAATAPVWTIRCAGTDRTLATLPLSETVLATTAFPVPADCPFQWLRLTLKAGGEQEALVDRVDVRPVVPGPPR